MNAEIAHSAQEAKYAEVDNALIAAALSYVEEIPNVWMETVYQSMDIATLTATAHQARSA